MRKPVATQVKVVLLQGALSSLALALLAGCQVKARNLDNLTAGKNPLDNGQAEVSPSVSLTSMTGGQLVAGGSVQAITWTATDTNLLANPITLEGSSDGGVTWSVIASGEANDGTYSWNVPSVNNSTYRVRVKAEDSVGNVGTASSTSNFEIDSAPPSLTLTSLTGGQVIGAGGTQVISWSASDANFGATPITVEVSANSGSSWTQLATGEANDGGYSWTVPAVNSSTYRVRVTAVDLLGQTSVAASTSDFTIDTNVPSVTLTSLTGAQYIKGGATYSITWIASDSNFGATPIAIEVSSNGGTSWSSLSASEANDGTYSWSVPAVDSTTYRVRVTATDLSANSAFAESGANFTIDNTAPSITLTSLTGGQTLKGGATQNITWTASDSHFGTGPILIEASSNGGTSWSTVASGETNDGTYAWTVPSVTSTTYRVRVTATDAAGNATSSASSSNFAIDSTAPTVVLTSFTGGQVRAGGATHAITWTIADSDLATNPITIETSSNGGASWTQLATGEAHDGTYSWTLPSVDEPDYRVRVSAVDLVGNVGTGASASNFAIDTSNPRVNSMSITDASPTDLRNIRVNLNASDDASKITHFCLRFTSSSQPSTSDSCWYPINANPPGVTPALSVSFTNFYISLGFAPATYTVYGWVKDEMSRINSSAGTAAIQYTPTTPPVITDVVAASSDSPSSPPSQADLTAAAGSTVYIKWKVTDDRALPATPITLYYTTDESTYTQIATGLSNGVNGTCTISGAQTGCYRWTNGAPASTYFKVRVAAQDSSSMITFSSASPLNVADKVNFLAGNTDLGLGASASSAMFFNDLSAAASVDRHTLVVLPNGTVYFRDKKRGLLYVRPDDGIQRLLIPTTGTSTGDGGPVSGATFRDPLRMQLDFQGRLLVFDYDRIRRIDLNASPQTIETIIGGGASTADGVAPTAVSISSSANSSFYVLPNGDIYFFSEADRRRPADGYRIRIYKTSTNLVTSLYPTGTGHSGSASQDITECYLSTPAISFDPATSEILSFHLGVNHEINHANCPGFAFGVNLNPTTGAATAPHPPILYLYSVRAGMNGKLYYMNRLSGGISIYDNAGNTRTALIGTGQNGTCADGTAALSCPIDPQDVFVTAQGQVYFMDRGRLRVLDENGKTFTVMGQSFSFGDGGNALSARFNEVYSIAQGASGKYILLDRMENRFREFTPSGTIATIAGDGRNIMPVTTASAATEPIMVNASGKYWDDFIADASTGDVYFSRGNNRGARLNRSTDRWVDFVGGGATHYASADGLTGSNFFVPQYPPVFLGFDGTNLLTALYTYNSGLQVSENVYWKLHAISNGLQAAFTGNGTSAAASCANGTLGTSCATRVSNDGANPRATYDSLGTRWIFRDSNDTQWLRTLTPGGNIGSLTGTGTSIRAFAYRRNLALTENIVYYCSNADGLLYKKDLNTNITTALSWSVPLMQCRSRTLIYDATRNSLVFSYSQNGMFGIAEYLNP